MNVKQLIEKLSKVDPNLQVLDTETMEPIVDVLVQGKTLLLSTQNDVDEM